MHADRILTDDDLVEVTGRKRRSGQARRLAQMGIPYRLRPDGRPLVLLSALSPTAPAEAPRQRPRLDLVR